MNLDEAAKAFREFVAVIKALRTPGTGCPWDLEQDHRTLRPYLVEEAGEVLDALARGDDDAFRDELGDLLLQVVLHAQVADDRAAFSMTDVVRRITEKMVRRHPHVFGSVQVRDAAEVSQNWEQIKAAEKAEAARRCPPSRPREPAPAEPSPAPDFDPLTCRRCGRGLTPGRSDAYRVTIEAVADPTPPTISTEELATDVRAEIERLIAQVAALSKEEALGQIYRRQIFQLCGTCYRAWIADPTRREAASGPGGPGA